MKMTALTIAGADPSGGAGIQSDIKTFRAFDVEGLSVITSLTAQNNREVKAVLPVPSAFLLKQIEVLMEEFDIRSVKIGMIGSRRNAALIARLLGEKRFGNTVYDPVLSSTGGYPLIDKGGLGLIIRKLLPHVKILTPNIPEASILTGIVIKDLKDMEEAAREISSMGPAAVLVKGGHMEGDPVDLLYSRKVFRYFKGKRIKGGTQRFHGTGCMLSAGIAAGLANGREIERAVMDAKKYVTRVLLERARR